MSDATTITLAFTLVPALIWLVLWIAGEFDKAAEWRREAEEFDAPGEQGERR